MSDDEDRLEVPRLIPLVAATEDVPLISYGHGKPPRRFHGGGGGIFAEIEDTYAPPRRARGDQQATRSERRMVRRRGGVSQEVGLKDAEAAVLHDGSLILCRPSTYERDASLMRFDFYRRYCDPSREVALNIHLPPIRRDREVPKDACEVFALGAVCDRFLALMTLTPAGTEEQVEMLLCLCSMETVLQVYMLPIDESASIVAAGVDGYTHALVDVWLATHASPTVLYTADFSSLPSPEALIGIVDDPSLLQMVVPVRALVALAENTGPAHLARIYESGVNGVVSERCPGRYLAVGASNAVAVTVVDLEEPDAPGVVAAWSPPPFKLGVRGEYLKNSLLLWTAPGLLRVYHTKEQENGYRVVVEAKLWVTHVPFGVVAAHRLQPGAFCETLRAVAGLRWKGGAEEAAAVSGAVVGAGVGALSVAKPASESVAWLWAGLPLEVFEYVVAAMWEDYERDDLNILC